ncbi:ribosomal L7Ae/L30e/S12e/Gadd45 family protein [Gemella sp. zg-1178]|uniref:L7Ae/L30e/S12e/Gadd45 family ribosomal protein n=1 Tax=Gemella sp. zg-1178 TaxID=2840372 RepID=UPI001C0469ED|nr:ribosomal L7Ae/L30e/S12e/Gadd45 family protein [Gemella sp. zg-1178]MBU0278549.1 ribosomal L7Ae/L30e/S12e/Gadd45 family protein [Gemella sp. zg-1178]
MRKALNLMGLMSKAGKVVTGEDLILKNIKNSEIKLLLIANDCGKNTCKKLVDKTKYYRVDTCIVFSIEELSRAIGKENRVAVGITDLGFSNRLKELIREEGGCIDNGKN